jgi:cytochrome P450
MAAAARTAARTWPPRWLPSFIRWHKTHVPFRRAWLYTFRAVLATWRHEIFDLIAELPGHDDIVLARAPIARYALVRNPDHARHVLLTNQDNYTKGVEYDLLAVGFGRGLVTELDDASWRRHRKLMQPVFAKRHVDGFAGQMTDAVTAAGDRWEHEYGGGEPLDIAAEMNAVTLDIIGRTMFGADFTGAVAQESREAFARLLRVFGRGLISGGGHVARLIARVLWRFGPRRLTEPQPRLVIRVLRAGLRLGEPATYRGLVRLEQLVTGLIAGYHATPPADRRDDNLLALLMQAEDPDTGARFSDDQVRDELMTFLGAGHETTASGLAWTWMLLSDHPDVRRRLAAEVDEALAGRVPTAADVPRLPWTAAVVQESMRLYPPVMGLTRVAVRDDVIDGIPIRAGTTVGVLIHGIHHHPGVWPEPRRFDPGRFMPGAAQPSSKQATMPFGAGRRMCIAAGFASLEAILIVATIAQRFELELIPQDPIRRENTFTGGPEGAVWMRLRPRAKSPLRPERADAADRASAARSSAARAPRA